MFLTTCEIFDKEGLKKSPKTNLQLGEEQNSTAWKPRGFDLAAKSA